MYVKPLLLSLPLCLVSTQLYAQSQTEMEKRFVEHLQMQMPDFRIVKKMEDFPDRYNASVKLPIHAATPDGSKTNRALVTLHDAVTGEPLESCHSPCTLHKSPWRSVFVFPYKYGHFTFPNEIEKDPAEMMRAYPSWDNKYEVKLGPDICAEKCARLNLPKWTARTGTQNPVTVCRPRRRPSIIAAIAE
jgi:hypothetical protein